MKKGCFAVALLLLVASVLVLTFALESHTPAPIALPTPNAYDVLVKTGSLVTDIPDDYAETQDAARLRSFIEANSEALDSLDNIHQLDCVVAYDRNAGLDAVMTTSLPNMGFVRQSMRLLLAHGRLAELEGDHAEAAKRYAKMFAIATKSANRGLLVDHLQSIGVERQALTHLDSTLDKLSAEEKLEVLAIIGTINRRPCNLDSIVITEHNLARNQHGRLMGTWIIRSTKDNQQPALDQFKQSDESVVRLFQMVRESVKN